ncbi:hypothetical protein BGX20_009075 [Mortierella sp. AD010]|nr:hypothetical protein BGX20_009075 [Mortierella sp. AD010]
MTVIEHAIAVLGVGGDTKDQSSTAVSPGGNSRVTRAKKVLAVEQDIKDASENEADEDDEQESDRSSNGSQSEDEESGRRDSGAEAEEPEEVDYEKQRQQNILRNQQLMMELGLQPISIRREFPIPVRPSKDKSHDDEDYTEEREYPKVRAKKRMRIPKPAYQPVQTRASKRIRGEPAKEYKVDLEALENGLQLDLNGKDQNEQSTLPPAQPGSYSKKQRWMGRKQTTGYNVEVEIPCACAPLTLGKSRYCCS